MRILLLVALMAASMPAADLIEQIIAKVNGDIITHTELDRSRKQMEGEAAARGMKPAEIKQMMDERSKDVLRDRIDQLLLVQKGKELNINVDSDVSRQLAEIQKRAAIADPEKFQQYIREGTGMSFEDFKAEMKNNILTQRVIGQEVYGKVNIPRADVEKYYSDHKQEFIRQEQVFLRELFISTEGKDAAAAERKAKDVAARAKKGEKFTDLIRDNSDAQSREDGGMLPGFKKGDLDKTIEDMIWDKSKNFVTDLIKRPNGFLILRVEDHVREGQATLDEVEGEIRDKLGAPIVQPRIREYLTRLRTEAFLEVREGFIDTGAAAGKDTSWSQVATLKPATVTKEEVSENVHMKRLLWMVPVPGTRTPTTGKSSSK